MMKKIVVAVAATVTLLVGATLAGGSSAQARHTPPQGMSGFRPDSLK